MPQNSHFSRFCQGRRPLSSRARDMRNEIMKFNLTSVYIVISRSKIDVNQLQIVIITANVFSKEVVNDKVLQSQTRVQHDFRVLFLRRKQAGQFPFPVLLPQPFFNISSTSHQHSTIFATVSYHCQQNGGITNNWCAWRWINMSGETMWCHFQRCCVMCVQTDVLWCHAGVSATLCGDFIVQEIRSRDVELWCSMRFLLMYYCCQWCDDVEMMLIFVIKRSMWWDDSMSWCLDVIE